MAEIDKPALLAEFTSGSDEQAEAAALQLAAHGTGSLPLIEEILQDPNEDVRWWAARSLAEIRDPSVTPLLLRALHDPEPAVGQCAALALRYQADPDAIPTLIQRLSLPDRLMARLAADALIATGDESVPALLEVMENKSQPARLEAARALGEIGDPRAIPALFKALDEDSAILEHWAGEGLEKMGIGMVFFNP
ncbi:MAG: HEAT repeat domain-containing protein [Anaerolineales bacterium]